MLKFKGTISVVLVCLALLPFANEAFTQGQKIRVLFIGNSLTFVNDLPHMVADLARSRHVDMECDMYAPGGHTFFEHAADPLLRAKIDQGTWDFVVLQEQSQIPALDQTYVQQYIYPYAQKLSESVRKANPQARVVFYMTMAKKNGDRQTISGRSEVLTYDAMQRRINASYTVMAQHNSALLAPVGVAWANVRARNKSLELYADEKHPNLLGTYLAACVITDVILKDNPGELSNPPQIDRGTAIYLQRMAGEAVRQSRD